MTPGQFIQQVAPDSVTMGKKYDVPASLLIAQSILESGNGNSSLAYQYNNLTGMKATGNPIPGVWDGSLINLPTTEVINGITMSTPQNFRAYNSWTESIADLADRYANRFKLTLSKTDNNVDQFFAKAMKTGYATDPDYATKVQDIIDQYNLAQFDKVILLKKKIGISKTKIGCYRQAA